MSSSKSIGKLYGPNGNIRTAKSRIAALYCNQAIEFDGNFRIGVDNKKPEYLSKFPLGQSPAFEINKDQTLTESSAIAFYIALQAKDNGFLGANNYEFAKIMQFVLFFELQVDVHSIKILLPCFYSHFKYNKVTEKEAYEQLHKALNYLNNYLSDQTYLVGERISLCDVVASCSLSWIYEHLTDGDVRNKYVNLTRYYKTIANQPNVLKINGEPKFGEEIIKYDPKKFQAEAKQQAPTKSTGQETQKDISNDEDEQPKAPKKSKSKLDLLPPSPFNLEDWKRFYSNNDTRPTAMDYFWKNYDKQGYSIWKVDYKYNDELTLGFMSCNLIGGFFNRLERAHKYAFGSMVVLGKDNDNVIRGYFVIRGPTIPEEVTDAADFESFEFKKIEDFETNPETREHIAAYFAWDDVIDGLPLIDGRVFK